MTRRIVVTGMGAVTPIGNCVGEFWGNLVAGTSGVGPIAAFDVSAYDTKIAAEVRNLEVTCVDKKSLRRMDHFVQYALQASVEAVADSGICLENEDRSRVGVLIGAGIGGLRVIENQHRILLESGPSRVSPFLIPMLIPDMAAGIVAIHFGCRGPNFATVSACASGSHALAVSLGLLRSGVCDVVISGGTESCITPLGLAGFCSLRALSTNNDHPEKASCPFDRLRDGFVMGEGAGIVILETLDHAKARGASIRAEFSGAGMSCDAYHMTAPDPDGKGAVICMRNALADAGITVDNVDYINAHGTSTQLNDKSETIAIKEVFGDRAKSLPISSNKSMVGHLLGAAGAVEFVASCLTIREGIIPPTINYENPDPECDLDYVPNIMRKQSVGTVLSNSFGFGGHNISLVAKRFDE